MLRDCAKAKWMPCLQGWPSGEGNPGSPCVCRTRGTCVQRGCVDSRVMEGADYWLECHSITWSWTSPQDTHKGQERECAFPLPECVYVCVCVWLCPWDTVRATTAGPSIQQLTLGRPARETGTPRGRASALLQQGWVLQACARCGRSRVCARVYVGVCLCSGWVRETMCVLARGVCACDQVYMWRVSVWCGRAQCACVAWVCARARSACVGASAGGRACVYTSRSQILSRTPPCCTRKCSVTPPPN